MVKNVLILIAAIVILVVLFSLAWVIAGFLIRLILALAIVAIIIFLIMWLVRLVRGGR